MRSERRKEHHKRLEHSARVAFHGGKLVDAYHESRHRGVVAEGLDVAGNFLYQLVHRFEGVGRGVRVGHEPLLPFP